MEQPITFLTQILLNGCVLESNGYSGGG